MVDQRMGDVRREVFYVRMVSGARLAWVGGIALGPLVGFVGASDGSAPPLVFVFCTLAFVVAAVGYVQAASVHREFTRSLRTFQRSDSDGTPEERKNLYLRECVKDMLIPWRLGQR